MKYTNLVCLLLLMVNNRRHSFLTTWASIQTYKLVPLRLRKTTNVCVFFKINKAEIKAIYNEIILDMTYDQFIKFSNYCFDKPYEYLVVHLDNNLYYKKSNQSILSNNKK